MRSTLLAALAAFFLLALPSVQAAPPKACWDHADNDGDGLIDFPADPGCDSRKDTDEFNAPPPGPAVLRDAVVLINFTNDQSQPYTVAEARTVAFDGPTSTAAFYQETCSAGGRCRIRMIPATRSPGRTLLELWLSARGSTSIPTTTSCRSSGRVLLRAGSTHALGRFTTATSRCIHSRTSSDISST